MVLRSSPRGVDHEAPYIVFSETNQHGENKTQDEMCFEDWDKAEAPSDYFRRRYSLRPDDDWLKTEVPPTYEREHRMSAASGLIRCALPRYPRPESGTPPRNSHQNEKRPSTAPVAVLKPPSCRRRSSRNDGVRGFSASNVKVQPDTGVQPPVALDTNFRVAVRVRPPLRRELRHPRYKTAIKVHEDKRHITAYDVIDGEIVWNQHDYSFDYVFDQDSKQQEVYEKTAKNAVMSVLNGYNATLIAYGQTSAGKTFTMEGKQNKPGIIPKAISDIFAYIDREATSSTKFLVRVSYLQIYNEQISDLLRNEQKSLQIREDRKRGVFVARLSEWVVRSPKEIYSLIKKGSQSRATSSTRMNEISSRSHAIFIIVVEQQTEIDDKKSVKVGKLNLVDLAGSERVRISGATGQRLEESKKINLSLAALGNVISVLTDPKSARTSRKHVPYRNSKLTRILEDSLGGNCVTTMIAMVSPAQEALLESLSTLKFAHRAKKIKNRPMINVDIDHKTQLRKYERELTRLRQQLQQRSQRVVDKRKLLEMEEARDRAVQSLHKLSQELLAEKAEKARLKRQIKRISAQVVHGGSSVQQSQEFRTALLLEQQKIRMEYKERLSTLEKERHEIERDKAQVDKYKTLLLKQRDIMLALTSKLSERDQSIVALQDELEKVNYHRASAQDRLDAKTDQLLAAKLASSASRENEIEKWKKIAEDATARQTQADSLVRELSKKIEVSERLNRDRACPKCDANVLRGRRRSQNRAADTESLKEDNPNGPNLLREEAPKVDVEELIRKRRNEIEAYDEKLNALSAGKQLATRG